MEKALVVLFCLALEACALPQSLPPATHLDPGASEVVVIGKIELVPPIDAEFEQRTYWNAIGEDRLLNNLFMATAAEHRPVNTSGPDRSDFQNTLEVAWAQPFAVKAARQRTFLNGGMTYLDMIEHEQLWFPGGYYFDVPDGATAIYIGTLRYHRNDFNRITKVEVINEPKDIAAALKEIGGEPGQVRTSLLKRVPAGAQAR